MRKFSFAGRVGTVTKIICTASSAPTPKSKKNSSSPSKRASVRRSPRKKKAEQLCPIERPSSSGCSYQLQVKVYDVMTHYGALFSTYRTVTVCENFVNLLVRALPASASATKDVQTPTKISDSQATPSSQRSRLCRGTTSETVLTGMATSHAQLMDVCCGCIDTLGRESQSAPKTLLNTTASTCCCRFLILFLTRPIGAPSWILICIAHIALMPNAGTQRLQTCIFGSRQHNK